MARTTQGHNKQRCQRASGPVELKTTDTEGAHRVHAGGGLLRRPQRLWQIVFATVVSRRTGTAPSVERTDMRLCEFAGGFERVRWTLEEASSERGR